MKKIALLGAGGKMGMRLTHNLIPSAYETSYCEISETGIARLKEFNLFPADASLAIPAADIVILAVPDIILGKVSQQTIPLMKKGAMVFTLDPAAAQAGLLFKRNDISYFVAHPAHPSVFNWEDNEKAQRDYFGGTLAKQAVVCALMSGPDTDYLVGEALAKAIYAPVSKAYRITVKQMALLEPALVETLSSTCLAIVREGLDEIIKKGVPEDAARAFLYGHMNIQLAVLFDQIPGAVFSDAANKAIVRGRKVLFKEDWKKIFEDDNLDEQIRDIIS